MIGGSRRTAGTLSGRRRLATSGQGGPLVRDQHRYRRAEAGRGVGPIPGRGQRSFSGRRGLREHAAEGGEPGRPVLRGLVRRRRGRWRRQPAAACRRPSGRRPRSAGPRVVARLPAGSASRRAAAYAVLRTAKPEFVHDITDDMLVQGAKDDATWASSARWALSPISACRCPSPVSRSASSRSPPPSRAAGTPRPTSPWPRPGQPGGASPSRTPGSTKRCGTPTAARTSSWRRWPTSCATRWPRSATPCT